MAFIRQFSEEDKRFKHKNLVPGGAHVDPVMILQYENFIKSEMDSNHNRIIKDVFHSEETQTYFRELDIY